MMTATNDMVWADGGVHLVTGMTIFALAGLILGLGALIFGRLLRPRLPNQDKGEPYECGEVAVGTSWVQFDLRFYVVALVFLVFDVEIALL
ncbi:MAG: NADH-quinone oxidoreductase subunit A, partial [Sedimentisphaerales bacterium]|nr:NADH-quinone oxidoreductase subunit A [Sedimentisphaerales bacterium]